jgi:hypothetical protein
MTRTSNAGWPGKKTRQWCSGTGRIAAVIAGWGALALPAIAQVPPAGIEEAVHRIVAIADTPASARAAERLWGMPLHAPVVVHDRASATSWRRDPTTGRVAAVALRRDQPPANTCITLAGTPTVLLLLPLPADRDGLATLYWHEQWHCAQAALGLPSSEGDTAHLDSEAGRTWLRLELRALAQALATADEADARRHAAAAVAFRAQRSGAAAPGIQALAEEARVERNEGLAEYTGRVVAAAGGEGDATPAVVAALGKADTAGSFVRSAAYATGPAYGLLLDRWSPQWRSGLPADADLPTLLARRIGALPTGMDQVGSVYGLAAVRSEERVRATQREQRSADYRVRFLGEEAVRLPLRQPSVSFDPRTLFPLDDIGTVYLPITVRDAWGELTAPAGGLLSKEWSLVSVQGGAVDGCGAAWTGPGWTLTLNEGWRLERHAAGWRLTPGSPMPCGN